MFLFLVSETWLTFLISIIFSGAVLGFSEVAERVRWEYEVELVLYSSRPLHQATATRSKGSAPRRDSPSATLATVDARPSTP